MNVEKAQKFFYILSRRDFKLSAMDEKDNPRWVTVHMEQVWGEDDITEALENDIAQYAYFKEALEEAKKLSDGYFTVGVFDKESEMCVALVWRRQIFFSSGYTE